MTEPTDPTPEDTAPADAAPAHTAADTAPDSAQPDKPERARPVGWFSAVDDDEERARLAGSTPGTATSRRFGTLDDEIDPLPAEWLQTSAEQPGAPAETGSIEKPPASATYASPDPVSSREPTTEPDDDDATDGLVATTGLQHEPFAEEPSDGSLVVGTATTPAPPGRSSGDSASAATGKSVAGPASAAATAADPSSMSAAVTDPSGTTDDPAEPLTEADAGVGSAPAGSHSVNSVDKDDDGTRVFVTNWPGDKTRRRAPVLAGLAALLALLTAAVAVFTVLIVRGDGGQAAARTQALAASKSASRLLFSYDYRHLAQDQKSAIAVTTGSFKPEYQKTTLDLVSKVAPMYKAVVVAVPSSASIVTQHGSTKVTALVFVNQQSTSTLMKGSKITTSRVKMDLTKVSGTWLVSGATTL